MKWWKEHPWRMVQTNLREIDFIGLDPESFVEEIRNLHATVLLLNAAGISASYPTSLEYHDKNPYIRGDELYRIVSLCHANGIRVIARCDFSKVKKHIYEKNPSWAFRTAAGDVMEYNGYVQTCVNSEYQQEYAFAILKEMFEAVPFDGLFCNMGGFQTRDYDFQDYGFCHCENCRRKFREMTGEELPQKEDYADPVYITYTRFQRRALREQREKIVRFLKEFPRELCFDDEDYARIEASTELQRRLPHWQYHASSNCRVITGDGTNGIICTNTTVEYAGYALREVSVSPALQALRLWQNLANRGALDYYFMGRPDRHADRCSVGAVGEIFSFHEQNQSVYRNLRPAARVLLRRQDRWVATEEEKGWIRVLTECHIPFCEILPWEYQGAALEKFDVVIIPDSPYLTEEEAARTDEFVRSGGTLVLVGESGLSDDRKGRRETYALKCTGVSRVREIGRLELSSLFIKGGRDKEYFPSSPETDLFGAWDTYIFTEALPECKGLLKRVPVHPYGPPECCYYTGVSDDPGVILHPFGRGRAVTVPWRPGDFYSKTGHSNPFLFMKDVLMQVCGLRSIADGLTPMVETSAAVTEDGSLLLQLVNTSGCFGVSFFEPLPVFHIKLSVELDFEPEEVRALRGGNVWWKWEDGILQLTLDRLEAYEAILAGNERV